MSSTDRILLVDDEEELVWALSYSLSDEGYKVFTAYNGVEALKMASKCQPDLLILDIIMPRLDGLEVCRAIRRNPDLSTLPILFLTQRDEVADRIDGLDQGGDDYLCKPFSTEELKARVKALLRRAHLTHEKKPRTSTLAVGGLGLDLKSHRVRAQGQEIQLTQVEFDLLHFLMSHSGQIFSSQDLLHRALDYPPSSRDSSLVRWHIKNVREKIEPDPSQPIHVCTVPRQGYILEENSS